ncbi:hypothetical protein PHISCL_04371 [Aspergillus sclerotialis]|uniref:DUF7702 domain-containing protein n=1 Tax=Aspergillus sclerotialis TaxID=2070753 RepID=A0A3A2ZPB2_9EURO|nr:hypothetical protein PHISCL_04371 [Aspergillus sclerotialis]
MLNDHSKASIAQIVFYAPALALAVILRHRHGRPRMPWVILSLFCIIRIACGIVVILHENKPRDVGLIVASFILLNAGVFPLIAATIGFLRIVTAMDIKSNSKLRSALIFTRILFLAGAVLLIAGGSLVANYKNQSDMSTGMKLVKAGYVVIVVFIACLLGFQAVFSSRRNVLSPSSLTVLKGILAAMPFIAVRITYLFLSVYHPSDDRWNDLSGAIGPFVVMVLLMEYVVVGIYITTGFLIPVIGKQAERFQQDSS